jgi:hypothetical protein
LIDGVEPAMSTQPGNPPPVPLPDNDAYDTKVESLAQKLLHGGVENGLAAGDIESARRVARRMLEESQARTEQASMIEPDDEDVIRRSSGETASVGESGPTPRVSDGD